MCKYISINIFEKIIESSFDSDERTFEVQRGKNSQALLMTYIILSYVM